MKEVCHTEVLVEANARVQSDNQVGNLEEGTDSSRQLDPRTITTCFSTWLGTMSRLVQASLNAEFFFQILQ